MANKIMIAFFALALLSITSCREHIGLINGVAAPDISLPTVDGKQVSLSSLRGNLVLVDFWASWCRPCRRENPYIVEVYNQFKNKSFKGGKNFIIYSVSLDMNKDAWQKAIIEDKLSWPLQVSELNGWKSSAVKTYQINSIPTNFLVDENGMIIGKDLKSEDLAKLLSARVKN